MQNRSFIINMLLYASLFFSLWLIFGKGIKRFLIASTNKYAKVKGKGFFYAYIQRMIRVISINNVGDEDSISMKTLGFIVGEVFLTFIGFVIGLKLYNTMTALMIAVIVFIIPILILKFLLWSVRVESSQEALLLITELYNQYKICDYNMLLALQNTVSSLKDAPKSRKILLLLTYRLNEYKDLKELSEILYDFVYAVNTKWIQMLANNIELAIVDGYRVDVGLEDIMKQLKEAKEVIEKGKRLNNEAMIIAKYLVPFVYLLFLYVFVFKFELNLTDYIFFQFKSTKGLMMFLGSFGGWIGCLVSIYFYKRSKFDFI